MPGSGGLQLPVEIVNGSSPVSSWLLYGLFAPLSGWALDQKRSCFEDAIGKVIASSKLDLIDDPLLEGAWGSRRFDGEGLTARRRHIVKGGKLAGYYLDSYYARKLGKEPTGGGRSNIVFSPGEGTLDALLKAAGKAVLVTNFLGGNSNSTTGDFSHGISGFVIEGGKRARPIASMNIAGNHGELWKTLTGWGADAYAYSSVRAPSLVFAPMVVSGK